MEATRGREEGELRHRKQETYLLNPRRLVCDSELSTEGTLHHFTPPLAGPTHTIQLRALHTPTHTTHTNILPKARARERRRIRNRYATPRGIVKITYTYTYGGRTLACHVFIIQRKCGRDGTHTLLTHTHKNNRTVVIIVYMRKVYCACV